MAEKSFDLRLAHFEGMTLFMKKNISFDPGDIGLFSSDRIVLPPNNLANLIQELLGRGSIFFLFFG